MKGKIFRIILMCVFAAVFVISAVNIVVPLMEQQKAEEYNNGLQNQFVTFVEDETHDVSNNSSDVTSGESVEVEKPNDITVFDENTPINVDFDALMALNNDVVGWLYCPNTPINYPVVKGQTNQEYLRKSIDGKYLKSGSLFADYRTIQMGDDLNYIIYGHNTSGTTMFGTLVKYKKQDYYNAHPTFYFITPEREYVVELVSGNVIHRYSDFYDTNPDFSMIEQLKKSSTFKSDVEISEGDKFITLSTCVWDFKDARFVVIGKVTAIG